MYIDIRNYRKIIMLRSIAIHYFIKNCEKKVFMNSLYSRIYLFIDKRNYHSFNRKQNFYFRNDKIYYEIIII